MGKFRHQTDPLADQVITDILKLGEENLVNQLLQELTQNSDGLPQNLPPEVKAYFDRTAHLPAWADRELIALGQDVFARHGMLISMILSCKSLPQTYVCANGAMVLYKTGRLGEQRGQMEAYTHRIVETAQFVVNVMSPGGLSAYGNGIRTTQKVRLIHATIRYFIRKYGWDSALYGEPINQEDMAGTLMAFSALVLEGLEKLNVQLTAAEKEAYIHCWRIVGHIMGVDEQLIPNNLLDGFKLGYAIMNHQMAESVQGKALATALVAFKETISPEGKLIGMVPEMIRFMVGDEIATMLGVVADPIREQEAKRRAREMAGIAETIEHATFWSGPIANLMSKLMLEGMLVYMGRGQRIRFQLPESLRNDWRLQTPQATIKS
ncbi:oxygenase MpaB family protein [Spirosoma soli]|uniref:Oxygenase MpaB family protein n=1 Tax=Spirosoma soli TaxID=1770529 RepID=A0ABW5M9P2_9BACT